MAKRFASGFTRSSAVLADRRVVHLPLRRVALCLDCEECFEIGADSCPACGSETWCSLARFLELGRRAVTEVAAPARQLVIVAANRPRLYDQLRRAFAGNPTVQVLTDRRFHERRQQPDGRTPDRRLADRRIRPGVDETIRALGWAVVRRGA